jgi:hypothetical protein
MGLRVRVLRALEVKVVSFTMSCGMSRFLLSNIAWSWEWCFYEEGPEGNWGNLGLRMMMRMMADDRIYSRENEGAAAEGGCREGRKEIVSM